MMVCTICVSSLRRSSSTTWRIRSRAVCLTSSGICSLKLRMVAARRTSGCRRGAISGCSSSSASPVRSNASRCTIASVDWLNRARICSSHWGTYGAESPVPPKRSLLSYTKLSARSSAVSPIPAGRALCRGASPDSSPSRLSPKRNAGLACSARRPRISRQRVRASSCTDICIVIVPLVRVRAFRGSAHPARAARQSPAALPLLRRAARRYT
jgi:hypothetical protein